MPICITCSTPVKNLYTTYSKADDRSLGKGVRLTQCPKCKRFADKYVEHDFVVLFIDLVLIKPQVYRHLLFNRLGRLDDTLEPSILRLGILLILFDVYLTWARIETSNITTADNMPVSKLSDAPIISQYIFFLTLNVLATLAQHSVVRLLARLVQNLRVPSSLPSPGPPASVSPEKEDLAQSPNDAHQPMTGGIEVISSVGPGRASPSAVSTALLVSSCTKLFPILLVIWPTQSPEDGQRASAATSFATRARSYVGWAVLLNNIEALLILLDYGYVVATGLALSGLGARWLVEGIILGTFGLEADGGPIGDLIDLIGRVGGWIGG